MTIQKGSRVYTPLSFASSTAVVLALGTWPTGRKYAIVRPISDKTGKPIECFDSRCGGGEKHCAICSTLWALPLNEVSE